MNLLKRLIGNPFCKHKFIEDGQVMTHAGMGKIFFYKCTKCPKEKMKSI